MHAYIIQRVTLMEKGETVKYDSQLIDFRTYKKQVYVPKEKFDRDQFCKIAFDILFLRGYYKGILASHSDLGRLRLSQIQIMMHYASRRCSSIYSSASPTVVIFSASSSEI